MSFKHLVATVVGVMGTVSAAQAANEMILLDASDLTQVAVFNIEGNFNRLVIDQQLEAEGTGNTIEVSIEGNFNGGPEGSSFTGVAAELGISPGSLSQSGFGNQIGIEVSGERNLFAVAQTGSNNNVRGMIIGSDNQAAIMQQGMNNFVSFSQNGIGNMISVRQISW